ncbi:serine/threonine-protein kinase VRK1-like [Glandiceps talaboti]
MPRTAGKKSAEARMPAKAKAAPKKRQPKGHKLPEHFPEGTVLTDIQKRQWQLGKSIGCGGFGEIYLAQNDTSKPVGSNAENVVKIEPHANGPLFVELHFYHRAGKPDMIEKWKSAKKLKHIGMPKLIASGNHSSPKDKYRFLVLERFSTDLQKVFESSGKKFTLKTAYNLGLQMLDVLEYLHEHEYVHADIKAGNILLGWSPTKTSTDLVYLVDFGLAHRYIPDGKHHLYKEDPSKAHDGTIEFTSRDAHRGTKPSRRGDIEILGYCILQWLCRVLPWEDNLDNKDYVKDQKIKYMSNLPSLMKKCFPAGRCPASLLKYFEHVNKLDYCEKPDYAYLKKLLHAEIKKEGYADDGKLDLHKKANGSVEDDGPAKKRVSSPVKRTKAAAKPRKRVVESTTEEDDDDYIPPPKKTAVKSRKTVAAVKSRNTVAASGTPKRKRGKQAVVDLTSDEDLVQSPPVKKTGRARQYKASTPRDIESPRLKSAERRKPRKRAAEFIEDSPSTSKVARTSKGQRSPRKSNVRSPAAEKQGITNKGPVKVKKSKVKKQSATISTQTSPGFYKR